MLNRLKLFIAIAFINMSCSAQNNMLETNIEASNNKEPIEDSVLVKLQKENDLVIAYAIENFAWVRSIDYRIIAKYNNDWKGYVYHKSMLPKNAATPTSFAPAAVNKPACDALLMYLTENKAWEIKGDSENGFCPNGSKNCNINDATSARLWFITKTSSIAPGYYAPEFFEKCCADAQRGLFLDITKKIEAIVTSSAVTE